MARVGVAVVEAVLVASLLAPARPGVDPRPMPADVPVSRDQAGYPVVPPAPLGEALRGALDGCRAEPASDGVVLLLPARAPGRGVVYVTGPYLLSRAAALLDAAGLRGASAALERAALAPGAGVDVALAPGGPQPAPQPVPVASWRPFASVAAAGRELQRLAGGLNPLYRAEPVERGLAVYSERAARAAVERSLYRAPGPGGYVEEYLPPATLVVALVDSDCPHGAAATLRLAGAPARAVLAGGEA